MIQNLKNLNKPMVVFFSNGYRYEGKVMAVDDDYLELYDPKRDYRKFIKVDTITDLEVQDE